MRTMPTIAIAESLASVTAQLNSAASLVHTAPRLARGSNVHRIAEYAARYDAERAELAAAVAECPCCTR